ncbi:Heat shock protein 67B2 [Armadillidium vulgare]|nr:Heat shock protein 67B2 [Armadillidium vulgare]
MTTITFNEINSQKDHMKIIDVRSKTEIQEHGKIPGSLNLPMAELEAGLDLDDEAFASKFGFQKPTPNDIIVTHCFERS